MTTISVTSLDGVTKTPPNHPGTNSVPLTKNNSLETDVLGSWDYRIVHRAATPVTVEAYNLAEVYYDTEGNITLWSTEVAAGDPDDLQDLKETVEQMADAFNKPVLEDADLPRGGCFQCVGCRNGACEIG